MIILDTDHISVLQRPSPAATTLQLRLAASFSDLFTTAITLEEQSKSWISLLGRLSSDVSSQVTCYDRMVEMFAFFAHWRVLTFSAAAADEFLQLRQQRVRIGTCDLKIAAIAIVEEATLLTANTQDFERVPNLQFENWLGG